MNYIVIEYSIKMLYSFFVMCIGVFLGQEYPTLPRVRAIVGPLYVMVHEYLTKPEERKTIRDTISTYVGSSVYNVKEYGYSLVTRWYKYNTRSAPPPPPPPPSQSSVSDTYDFVEPKEKQL